MFSCAFAKTFMTSGDAFFFPFYKGATSRAKYRQGFRSSGAWVGE